MVAETLEELSDIWVNKRGKKGNRKEGGNKTILQKGFVM